MYRTANRLTRSRIEFRQATSDHELEESRKIEVKSEVTTTETQQQGDRGKEGDSDSRGNENKEEIRSAASLV
jgi:hypothetical protein